MSQTSVDESVEIRERLRAEFEARIQRNASYSLRAFARDLKIAPSTLSETLNGKTALSVRCLQKVMQAMAREGKDQICLQAQLEGRSRALRHRLNPCFKRPFQRLFRVVKLDIFQRIPTWYEVTLIEALFLTNVEPTLRGLAKRLSLKESLAAACLDKLCSLQLIEKVGDQYKTGEEVLEFGEDRPFAPLRAFHKSHVQDALTGKVLFDAGFASIFPQRAPLLDAAEPFKTGDRLAIGGLNFFALVRLDAQDRTVDVLPGLKTKSVEIERHFAIDPETTPEFFMLLNHPIEIAWAPNDRLVTTTARLPDGQSVLRLWDPASGKNWGGTLLDAPVIRNDQPSVGFSGDFMIMYVFTERGVEFFDVANERKAAAIHFPETMKVLGGEVTPDLRAMALAMESNGEIEVGIYDLNTRGLFGGFRLPRGENVRWVHLDSKRPILTVVGEFKYYQFNYQSGQSPRVVTLNKPDLKRHDVDLEYWQMGRSHVDDDAVTIASAPTVPSLPPNSMGNKSEPNRPFGEDVLIYRLVAP